MTCGELPPGSLEALLARFGLCLERVAGGAEIPGSHWGAPEAGLLQSKVFIRDDTPVHSALHEACHVICMDGSRRFELDTNAGGTDLEENAVCYLQILLADHLPQVGADRLMRDMDRWGYSFRLGSTRAWFEEDAEDALAWLREQALVNAEGAPLWQIRP